MELAHFDNPSDEDPSEEDPYASQLVCGPTSSHQISAIDEPSECTSFVVPEIQGFATEACEDEVVHSVAPRQLFQSEAVERETSDLGERLDDLHPIEESNLPEIHLPRLFEVSSRDYVD